jgi:nucleoside-diphosphate-sugar epimerase
MLPSSSITVTGATGWLGKELINILTSLNLENLELDLISSSEQEIEVNKKKFKTNIFTKNRSIETDIYFDFAFLTREKILTLGKDRYIEMNKSIIDNSIDLIQLKHPKTVILASSGAVYSQGCNNFKEDNNLYSELKLMQEEKIRATCDDIGINLIVTRIFNLSGNGINKINTFAIAELISRAFQNQKLHIRSNYLVYRRYCDISQLLNLLLKLHEINFSGIIDSGGIKIELRDLARTIVKQLGSYSELDFSDIGKDSSPDDYFSKSNLYDELLVKYLNEKPMLISKQITNTKNSLFPLI